MPVAGANNSFKFSNFRIFGLWDGEIIFTFWISLSICHNIVIALTLGVWRCYTKLTKHMWKEDSRFHVKYSLNPEGKGINDVFAKRKILRQINVNISVLETWRTLRSCKVISIPVPSITEWECEVSTTSRFCRRKAKVSRN